MIFDISMWIKRSTCKLSMLFALLIFDSASVRASEKNSETSLLFAVLEMTPYGFRNNDNTPTGVLYEISHMIAKEMDITLANVDLVPGLRIHQFLRSEQKVCTIVADTPDIKGVYNLLEPIGLSVSAGIVPAKGLVLNEYSDLSHISIAVPSAVQFDEKFHNDDSLHKVDVPDYVNAIKMLANNRVDAVAGAVLSLKHNAKLSGYSSDIYGEPLIFFEAQFYLVCNDGLTIDERSSLGQLVIELRDNGEISKILDSYFLLDKRE